jgi:hypothetical protein
MKPKTLAIVGCRTLAIGCFLPRVNEPIVGQTTYVLNGDGRIVELLAVVGFSCHRQSNWLDSNSRSFVSWSNRTHFLRFRHEARSNADIAWPVLIIGAMMLVAASCMQELKGLSCSTQRISCRLSLGTFA